MEESIYQPVIGMTDAMLETALCLSDDSRCLTPEERRAEEEKFAELSRRVRILTGDKGEGCTVNDYVLAMSEEKPLRAILDERGFVSSWRTDADRVRMNGIVGQIRVRRDKEGAKAVLACSEVPIPPSGLVADAVFPVRALCEAEAFLGYMSPRERARTIRRGSLAGERMRRTRPLAAVALSVLAMLASLADGKLDLASPWFLLSAAAYCAAFVWLCVVQTSLPPVSENAGTHYEADVLPLQVARQAAEVFMSDARLCRQLEPLLFDALAVFREPGDGQARREAEQRREEEEKSTAELA